MIVAARESLYLCRVDLQKPGKISLLLAILALSWWAGGFPAFHEVLEGMCLIAALSIYVIGTRTYRFSNSMMLLYISVAFMYVGGLEVLHLLNYSGVSLLPGASANRAAQFWTASRALEIGAICAVPLVLKRKSTRLQLHLGFFAAFALLTASILAGIFPACFVEGSGFTAFRRWAELAIAAASAASMVMMKVTTGRVGNKVSARTMSGVAAFGVSGLVIALALEPQGALDALAHLLSLLSFAFFWSIVIEEGLDRPYEHMFREIYERSSRDILTGLYNRAGFDRDAETALAAKGAEETEFSLFAMDLDDFKRVNDDFGHPEGDVALKEFAAILTGTLGEGPLVARYGGDEFVVLAEGGAAWASAAEARLRGRAAAWRESPRRAALGLSLAWVSRRGGPGAALEALYREADALMLDEKRRKHAR
jgi:diguanylate cyclase (GGDEF)-like protein